MSNSTKTLSITIPPRELRVKSPLLAAHYPHHHSPLYDWIERYAFSASKINTLFGCIHMGWLKSDPSQRVVVKVSALNCIERGYRLDPHERMECAHSPGAPLPPAQHPVDDQRVGVLENVHSEMRLLQFLSQDKVCRPYVGALIQEYQDEHYHCALMEYAGVEWYALQHAVSTDTSITTTSTSPELVGRIPERVVRVLFRQLAQAVHCLHQRHVAHLDISTENICVDVAGHVRLIDFGVARMHPYSPFQDSVVWRKIVSQHTDPVKLLGDRILPPEQFRCEPIASVHTQLKHHHSSPVAPPGKALYMSPELFNEEAWDAYAADTYALGVVLYHMLTSRRAYQAPVPTMDPWFDVLYSGKWLEDECRKQPPAMLAYGHVSAGACDLINRLIAPPTERLTSAEIVKHPWLCNITAAEGMEDDRLLEQFLQTYSHLFNVQHQ